MLLFVYCLEIPANDKWPNMTDVAPLRGCFGFCLEAWRMFQSFSARLVRDTPAQRSLDDKKIGNEGLGKVKESLQSLPPPYSSLLQEQATKAQNSDISHKHGPTSNHPEPSVPIIPPVPMEDDFDGSTAQWTDQTSKSQRKNSLAVKSSTTTVPERNAWQEFHCSEDQDQIVGETY